MAPLPGEEGSHREQLWGTMMRHHLPELGVQHTLHIMLTMQYCLLREYLCFLTTQSSLHLSAYQYRHGSMMWYGVLKHKPLTDEHRVDHIPRAQITLLKVLRGDMWDLQEDLCRKSFKRFIQQSGATPRGKMALGCGGHLRKSLSLLRDNAAICKR
jgi:hypothetical protein